MSVVDRLQETLTELKRLRDEQRSGPDPLQGGGGSGTSGGMEARLAKLEAQMDAVKADLGKMASLPVDVARLDERVKHLPGKGFIVTATSTSVALIAALVLFADKLRALVAG